MKEAKVLMPDLEATSKYAKVYTDNTIQIPFSKWFNSKKDLDYFVLKKKRAYSNGKYLTCGYINYFVENYDNDKEFITTYLQLKFLVDENKMFKDDEDYFIEFLYDTLFTDTIVEKIQAMTADLYHIDVEKKKTKKSKKNYSETLQFVNEHGEIIMSISVAIKLMIPIITHYIYKSGMKSTGYADIFLAKCYAGLHELFEGEYIINNKFYELIASRIMMTVKDNKTVWYQGQMRGLDYEVQSQDSLDKLYVDILPKLTYSGNVVHYIVSSMDNNVNNKLNEKYKFDYNPITSKQVDGFTGFEKMEMHTARFDESTLIHNKINLEQTIDKLQKQNLVEIDDDEIEYYMANIDVKPFQRELIFQYYAKYFGSPKELYGCNKRKYCTLVIILKKILEDKKFQIIQHILTGKLIGYMDVSRAHKKKQMARVISSERYENLMKYKYSGVLGMFDGNSKNVIEVYIGLVTSARFELVDYEYREKTGKLINNKANADLICDELLRFIEEI